MAYHKKLKRKNEKKRVQPVIATTKMDMNHIIDALKTFQISEVFQIMEAAMTEIEERTKEIDGKGLKVNQIQPTTTKMNQAAVDVSDIESFFHTSSRNLNDATNKIREKVLKVICQPPQEYLEHEKYGASWKSVYHAWNDALQKIACETGIPEYTSTQIKMYGGRGFNYDAVVMYHGPHGVINRKIEFKNGGMNIGDLPQFLSLQAKIPLFEQTYDSFWYDKYLDKYLACDTELTQSKPSREEYLKKVTSTNYAITPFFAQLKSRELFFQKEKNEVVNASIADYLSSYGHTIDRAAFSEKVKATQIDKIYLLWSNGTFNVDKVSEQEMTEMSFHSIKNGNILELKSGNTIYGLLLRWRNHKGILNPAWQISMKRTQS